MKVSFVCAVYGLNKLTELRRMIASVENQFLDTYELIIVDQNNCNSVQRLILEFANTRIVYVKSPKGLSKARNIGLKMVQYEWVCFPDDDCFYPIGFFDNLKKSSNISDFLIVNVRDIDEVSETNFTKRNINGFLTKNEIFYNSCSISIFLKYNSQIIFDERFGLGAKYGSCEDYDFCLQHYVLGKRLYFLYDSFVCHPKNDNIEYQDLLLKIDSNSTGHGAFFAKWIFTLGFQVLYQLVVHLVLTIFFIFNDKKRIKYFTSSKSRMNGFFKYLKEDIFPFRA